MKKGQVLSTDMLVSLMLVAVSVGMIINALSVQQQQMVSTVESSKMHQIALDAAAVRYYDSVDCPTCGVNYDGLDGSAGLLGCSIGAVANPGPDACIVSTRGTQSNPINVFVCRG
ncbi:hypothetical protein K8R43_00910 [archaeon]|nr:hypothetical protein [archaeon]